MRERNKENKGLPSRWRHTHGGYYYCVPKGEEYKWDGKQTFRLGKTLPEAYREWAKRYKPDNESIFTIAQLFDRYLREVVPLKAPRTQKNRKEHIAALRPVFGHMPIDAIEPQDVYRYIDNRTGKANARKEISALSHIYTKAIQWGYINTHPLINNMRLEAGKPRTRYVEDWEIVECLELPPMRKKGSVSAIQAYIRLKLLTGLRRSDLLRLKLSDCKEDGIHVTPHKTQNTTGKAIIYVWSESLREAIKIALDSRPIDISPYLFCTKEGKCYFDEATGEAHGWATIWQRFMKRVMSETKVKERFTEHDLRAKCASDAETLEHAQALLSHADSKITSRIYRRKAEKVRPLR